MQSLSDSLLQYICTCIYNYNKFDTLNCHVLIFFSEFPVGKLRVDGSIPGGDIYSHFEFVACFPFLTA